MHNYLWEPSLNLPEISRLITVALDLQVGLHDSESGTSAFLASSSSKEPRLWEGGREGGREGGGWVGRLRNTKAF